jgi:integrase/recombinase XerD
MSEDEALAAANITGEDKALIKKFVAYKVAEKGITTKRVEKLLSTLRMIATRYLKGHRFQNLNKDDIINIVAAIEHTEDLKAWTRRDYKLIFRMFLLWLGKDAAWVKVTPPKNDLQAEEMLTPDEVNALIDVANSLRDKALIASLYEGGFRVAELGNTKIKDLVFDEYGAVVIVRGKTGVRRVRLISSVPYLQQWLEAHPCRKDRNAPLWISTTKDKEGETQHTILKYDALRLQLGKLAKKAGIKKRVNPHNFRHSRASYLASRLTESQLEQYLGWEHGSSMPRTYVHMSGRDVDTRLLEIHGLDIPRKKDEPTTRLCPTCKALNQIKAGVCWQCKRPLDMKPEDYISLEDQLRELREEHERLKSEMRPAAFVTDFLSTLAREPALLRELAKMLEEQSGE